MATLNINRIRAAISLDTAPVDLKTLVSRLLQNDGKNELQALEEAEKMAPRLLSLLARHKSDLEQGGKDCWFDFNSIANECIQGPCFIEPGDLPEIRLAKQNRSAANVMPQILASLDPGEFEDLCGAVMQLLGAREFHKTKRTRDQGIDFYASLYLVDLDPQDYPFFQFHDNLRIWVVGQAKHYPDGKVSTPEIRNLVGSINLARFKEYASTTELMSRLPMRSCDPIFALFLTSGEFSRDGRQLADNSGVILKDVHDLSRLLADRSVGRDGSGNPSKTALLSWVNQTLNGQQAAP